MKPVLPMVRVRCYWVYLPSVKQMQPIIKSLVHGYKIDKLLFANILACFAKNK